MRRCEHCDVTVEGEGALCPLCHGPLRGEASPDVFPVVPLVSRRYHLLIRLAVFLSVVVAVVCLLINRVTFHGEWWSLLVLGAIGSLWVSLVMAVRKRTNLPKGILWQVVLLSLLSLAWDWGTGWHRWSINYVIPLVCMLAMLAIALLSRVIRKRLEEVLVYLLIDGALGIAPLVFLLAGWVSVELPSLLCVAVSVLFFVAIILFWGDVLRGELSRRFHI